MHGVANPRLSRLFHVYLLVLKARLANLRVPKSIERVCALYNWSDDYSDQISICYALLTFPTTIGKRHGHLLGEISPWPLSLLHLSRTENPGRPPARKYLDRPALHRSSA